MSTPLLSLHGVRKAYGAPVLRDVALEVRTGEVHALVGANGAGKSTLGRIVCGLAAPDQGEMRLSARPYAPRSKGQAEAAGVHMVMQELSLVSTLSVAENLFLSRLPSRFGLVQRDVLERRARQALAAVGLERVDPWLPAERLGVGQQQMVEIASVLARPRLRLVILDEPTAALTDPQAELLFTHMARLARDGVAFVYVSHRMEEIRRVADRVTVLRDGAVVATAPASSLSIDEMVRLMSGRGAAEAMAGRDAAHGAVALRVSGLRSGAAVKDVSLTVHQGEILGLAGLVGSGRTETLRAIYGADRAEAGEVTVGGRAVRIRHPRDAVRLGLGMVPEDRKTQGLLLDSPLRVNVTLARMAAVRGRGGWLRRARERALASDAVDRLDIRAASVEQPAGELSGGNQQKVLFARWLLRDPAVLLVDEPTRGIDVAAKRGIHRVLRELAERGKAIVMVSSDLRELMEVADRLVVISDGRSVAELPRAEFDEDRILGAAFSGYLGGAAASVSAMKRETDGGTEVGQ